MISSLTKPYPVLTGYYWFMYFFLEPLSLILTWITVFLDTSKGALWFYNELVPSVAPLTALDPRATTAMWHITNTYLLMAVAELMLHTNIRDRVHNLADQERAVGLMLAPLGVADFAHVVASWVALPDDLRWNPAAWNSMLHGNITFSIVLCAGRFAWLMGIGRKSHYWAVPTAQRKK